MKYIEFKVHATRQGIEQVTAMYMKYGITDVSIDDPADMQDILDNKNEYGWDYIEDEMKENLDREPTISCFFEDNEKNREKVQILKVLITREKTKGTMYGNRR